MEKKNKNYTSLSDIDHKMQFVNLIGIINEITPIIKRNKMLGSVLVEINDATLSNPGFVTKLVLESEVLDQFLATAKQGLIIEFLDIEVSKNDGEIQGEVVDEDEVHLYSDDGTRLKWWIEEKKCSTPVKVKQAIEELNIWKKKNLKGNQETQKEESEFLTQTVSPLNKIFNNSNQSKNKKVSKNEMAAKDVIIISNETSPKEKANKIKNDSAVKTDLSPKRLSRNSIKGNSSSNEPIQRTEGKRKLPCVEIEETNNKSSGSSKKKRSVSPPKKEVEETDNKSSGSSKKKRSVSPPKKVIKSEKTSTDSKKSEISKKSTNKKQSLNDSINRREDKKVDQKKTDKSLENKLATKDVKKLLNESKNDLGRETRQNKNDSSDITSTKIKSNIFKLEKSTRTSIRTKNHLSNSFNNLHSSSSSVSSNDLGLDVSKQNQKIESSGEQSKLRFSNILSSFSSISSNDLDGSKDDSIFKNTSVSKEKKLSVKSHKQLEKQNIESNDNPDKAKEANDKKNQVTPKTHVKITRSRPNSLSRIHDHKTLKCLKSPTRHSLPVQKKKLNSNGSKLSVDPTNSESDKNKLSKKPKEINIPGKKRAPHIETPEDQEVLSNGNLKTKETLETQPNLTKLDIKPVNNVSTPVTKRESVRQKSLTLSNKPPDLGGDETRLTKHDSPLQEGSGTNFNRKSKSGIKETKSPKDKKDIFSYLAELTRKNHLVGVETESEVSLCDIRDVDISMKMDLQCKVLSNFHLFEDNIQIIRVQDGTTCNSPILHIPEKSSWDEIITTVLNNPKVVKNSPFIDIIIFDFPRLDKQVVTGGMYEFKNIMAVKFSLKEDPRKEKNAKSELFFCGKGPNMYSKVLPQKLRPELEERINEEKYKKLYTKYIEDEKANEEKSNENVERKSCKEKDNHLEVVYERIEKKSTNKKRKLSEGDLGIEDSVKTSDKKIRKVKSEGKLSSETQPSNTVKTRAAYNTEETVLGETECAIIRELSEIMHEGSQLGVPNTVSEDIHLKNSGSEITFSQFCEGARNKSDAFRTSTQVDDEVSVLLDQKEASHTPDSSKMEALEYCSSSSATPDTPLPNKPEHLGGKDSSPSILLNNVVTAISNKTTSGQEINVQNSESPLEIVSSNSSELQFEVISIKDCSNVKNNSISKTKNKISKERKCTDTNKNLKENKIMKSCDTMEKKKNELKNVISLLEKENESCFEEVENASTSSNSTIVSDFSLVNCNKPDVSQTKNSLIQPTDLEKIEWEKKYGFLKNVTESCFYKAKTTHVLSPEEIDAIHNDESDPLKYCSYSHNYKLPFVTLAMIEKVGNKNYITVTVTLDKISPSLTDSWREECIKAKCPCCNKLYHAYSALNGKCAEDTTAPNALYVKGLIVCPESQCCNQVLETPEFHFSVGTRLKDDSPVEALLAGSHAEHLFGCKAQDAARDRSALECVENVLQQISTTIIDKKSVKVDFTRENILNPKSGPLYIKNIHF